MYCIRYSHTFNRNLVKKKKTNEISADKIGQNAFYRFKRKSWVIYDLFILMAFSLFIVGNVARIHRNSLAIRFVMQQ